MNYFELYELPVAFVLDEKLLRKKFLELSKKYHPDFYTQSGTEKQSEILELSTLNNKAFQTLGDFNKRMQYVLKLAGVLEEEEKFALPQIFLMEMMDLNEMLMELQFDPDPAKAKEVLQHLNETGNHLYKDVEPFIKNFDFSDTPDETYQRIKEYYYKNRYLLRIRQQMDKFALPD